jgi:hypothetical protein
MRDAALKPGDHVDEKGIRKSGIILAPTPSESMIKCVAGVSRLGMEPAF